LPDRAEVRVLKTAGYLISTISVLLLGAVAWTGTAEHPAMRILLILGMSTSIAGMFLRWLSYRGEQREKRERARMAPARATASSRLAERPQSASGGLENVAASAPR
jgi:hypothetical protein